VGLFTEATIEGRVVENVVVLPRSALRGKDGVLIVDAEDRLHLRNVDVLRVDREVAVITGGLEGGELVCLSPIEVAVDGMKVRVQRSDVEPTVVAGAPSAEDEEADE
jgi:multidrug efflux pump subunit AcrA (membrane-fusion protein)